MNQKNVTNKYLFHVIDDIGLDRHTFTVRKELKQDAHKFLWNIKQILHDTFSNHIVEKILSPEIDRMITTPVLTNYAKSFKVILATSWETRGPTAPPSPQRQKRNAKTPYNEITQGKKICTASPERTTHDDINQRLNQLHLAAMTHTKSSIEVLEQRLETVINQQKEYKYSIAAQLEKASKNQEDKVKNMLKQQNDDIIQHFRKWNLNSKKLQKHNKKTSSTQWKSTRITDGKSRAKNVPTHGLEIRPA